MLVGALDERLGTRDLSKMGGLWSYLPRFGGVGMFLAMAALGLPALGNFLGEFLILLGAYQVNRAAAVVAALGMVFATVYALWFVHKVFHGPESSKTRAAKARRLGDLSIREIIMMAVVVGVILWLGLYPQALVNTTKQSNEHLFELTGPRPAQSAPTGMKGNLIDASGGEGASAGAGPSAGGEAQ
jgi:NADH-quinone oxidoreductase subunit M